MQKKEEDQAKMSVCSRRMKCCVSSGEVPQPRAASVDTEGMGLLLVALACSERALIFIYSSVHPTRQYFYKKIF